MSDNKGLIKIEDNGTISFGDHKLLKKEKVDSFEVDGNIYKVKSFNEFTKLERNGNFIYESLPGSTVSGFELGEKYLKFKVESDESLQITVELAAKNDYTLYVDGVNLSRNKTNFAGKLSFVLEPCIKPTEVKIVLD